MATNNTNEDPPIDVNGIEHPDEDTLILTYEAENHNCVIRRTYEREGHDLHFRDEEYLYNFTSEEWDRVRNHTHTYEVDKSGTRLVGDGSGWDGDGEKWVNYFIQQHYHRLDLRFNEPIPTPDKNSLPNNVEMNTANEIPA